MKGAAARMALWWLVPLAHREALVTSTEHDLRLVEHINEKPH